MSFKLYKIYIWTLVLELVMYLTFDLGAIFLPDNIRFSRLLQVSFLGFILFSYLANGKNYLGSVKVNKYIIFFFAIIIGSTFVYVLSGGYESAVNALRYNSTINHADAAYAVYKLPLREFVVYLYIIFYYILLSQIFIKTNREIEYFFKVFEWVFFISIFLGILGLLSAFFDHQLFARQFNYGEKRYIGLRFHGMFGEPRDASVALMFGLAIMHLKMLFLGKKTMHKGLYLIIIILALVTQSGSLVLSLLIFIPLYLMFNSYPTIGSMVKLFFIISIVIGVVIVLVTNIPRLSLYYTQIMLLPDLLQEGVKLPTHINTQLVNIYPFWLTYNKILAFDFFSLVFGSGLAATAIEKYSINSFNFSASHAQLPRLIFEFGIAGFFTWFYMLFHNLSRFKNILPAYEWNRLFALFILLCAAALAHRSHLIYIYVGIAYSIYRVMNDKFSKNFEL